MSRFGVMVSGGLALQQAKQWGGRNWACWNAYCVEVWEWRGCSAAPVLQPSLRTIMSVTAPRESSEFWPLRLVLRRKRIERGLWEVDHWSVESIESDRGQQRRELLMEPQPPSADTPADCQDYLCSGLGLELFRDERAAYRFNLSAAEPRLFVICAADDEEEGAEAALMRPYLISASQDAASSYMDGGDEDVFSLPMPSALQCWIEAFIVQHGEPDLGLSKGKRRRYRGGRKVEALDE